MTNIHILKRGKILDYPFLDTNYSDKHWTVHTPSSNDKDKTTRLNWIKSPKIKDKIQPHPDITTDCKNLLLATVFHTREGKKIPAAKQIVALHDNLKSLTEWLCTDGHNKIASINEGNINNYIFYLRNRRKKTSEKELAKTTIAKYLYCITELHAYSDYLKYPMKYDPLNGESTYKFMGCSETDTDHHPATPKEIATPLILRSLALIEQVSGPALKNLRTFEKADATDGYFIPLKMKYYSLKSIDGFSPNLYAVKMSDLAFIVRMCVAAAAIVITYLTGLRRSELLGLENRCWNTYKKTESLPDYCVIKGYIYKGNTDLESNKKRLDPGEKHKWYAPIDVVPSLKFLAEISKNERAKQKTNKLWPVSTTKAGSKADHVSSAGDVSFNSLNVSLNQLPHYMDIEMGEWNLNLTQGRKTFAKFFAMRDRTQLHALATQFGHIDRLVTEFGYSQFLYDFSEELEAEEFNALYSSYESIVESRSLAGIAGNTITELKHSYKGGFTKMNKDRFIRKMIDADITVFACDWAFCLFEKGASKCNEGEAAPSDTFKEPFLCSTCSNFCATEEHFEFWNDMKHETKHLKKMSSKESQTYRLANERLKSINVIIENLEPIS